LRDSLTVLAILVIGVLTAALVGPHFVDWNSHRALIENKLSQAAGTRVTVAGPIDLTLLPRPIFRFGDVTVGDPAPGRPHVTARGIDAEISLTALMRGEVQVVDTTVEAPRLDLAQAADGGFGLPLPDGDGADKVRIDDLKVRDGTLALALTDGRRVTVSGLDLAGDAVTLRGPFKATGRFGPAEAPVAFRLAAGTLDRGRLRLKLHLDGSTLRPSLDLDGTVGQGPSPASFDGTAGLAGTLPLAGTPADVPWRMTTHVTADTDKISASDVEIRAGTDMRALIATGDGSAELGAPSPGAGRGTEEPRKPPSGVLHLHGGNLDLDDLAVAPKNAAIAPPKGLDLVRLLVGLADDGTASVSLPLRLALDARFDTATLDGQTFLATSAKLGLGPEPTAGVGFATTGPDGARLSFDGRFEPGSTARLGAALAGAGPLGAGPLGAAPLGAAMAPYGTGPHAAASVFRGHAEVQSADLTRTAAWLQPMAPGLAAWLTGTIPARSLAVAGDIEASRIGATARNLSLGLDRSRFAGTLSFTRAVGAEPARLFADLASDTLDLDNLPDLSGAAAASRDLDLDLALSARTVTLSGAALPGGAATGPGSLDAGHVALQLRKTGRDLRLDRLSLDIGGATVEATAVRTGTDARAEAHVRAPKLDALAKTFGEILPGWITTALRDRAATLSPFDGTFRAEATVVSGEAALVPTRLDLDGSAGKTHVVGSWKPDHPDDGLDAATRPVTLSAHAGAPEATGLLRQFGLATGDAGLGAASIEGTARGSLAAGFAAEARARIGATTLSYRGRAQVGLGAGRLDLQSDDVGPLLASLGIVPAPASAADPGPATPVAVGGDFGWTDARLSLRHMAGKLGTAAGTGDLFLDLTPRKPGSGSDRPILTGALSLDRLPAEALLGLALGDPAGAAGVSPPAIGRTGAWSDRPFGPAAVTLPRSEVALKLASLPVGGPLPGGLEGRSLAFNLRVGNGAVTFADIAGRFGGGTVGGTLTLRHDGPTAALSGRVTWNDVALDFGGLSGQIGGTVDMSGTGDSPAALVASLAGPGSLTLAGAALARTDPEAPARTAAELDRREAAADPDSTGIDSGEVQRSLAAELDRGPLALGSQTALATLAGGVLRSAPLHTESPRPANIAHPRTGGSGWQADTEVSVDLGRLAFTARTTLHPRGTAAERNAEGGDVIATLSGPFDGQVRRDVDATGFVVLMQARAIARAQERIDVTEQDIRERAAFNRQLKAIEADQQAARDRTRVEAEAAAAARAATVAAVKADAAAKLEAAAKAAAAERAAAEARRAEAARLKAEDARVQAEVEAAARSDTGKAEAEKRRFIDNALKGTTAPLPLGPDRRPGDAATVPPRKERSGLRGARSAPPDAFDIRPPPSIMRDGTSAPGTADPSAAGRY
jgi:uncharacterized protein involved in outer membrane biogenesis